MVLGHRLANKLFADEDPLGRQVRFNQATFRVIGVLRKSNSPFNFGNEDDAAYGPFSSVALQFSGGNPDISIILASARAFLNAANRLVFRLLLIWAVIIAAMTLYGWTM